MRYDSQLLKKYGTSILMQAGLEAEEAEILVESLLYADSRGVSSHGLSRLDVYTKRVEHGVIATGVNIKIIQESPASLVLDGQNGVGAKIARQALELTMKKARESGCCVTTVRNGNHFGAGSFYSKYAAEHGMIAIVASNSEAAVAPIGGAAAMLGTNPLAMAVPAACSAPFDLDMATSVSSRGKVVLAQKEGRSIPPDWAVDRNGVPTTDPGAVLDGGFMLPFGGVKGYSISLFIDLMCSCLGGAQNCRETSHFWTDYENPQDIGYFMIVIDPSKFLPIETFKVRVADVLKEFHTCPPAPGVKRVYTPGEIEAEREQISQRDGIEISDAVMEEVLRVGRRYGVTLDI